MFTDLTSAETLGWFAIIVLISIPVVALLVSWGAFALSSTSGQPVFEPGLYGTPAAFREPADPSYVDELLAVRARMPVVHRPDPAELAPIDLPSPPVSPAPTYSIPLAELVASVRYVMPAQQAAARVHSHRAQGVDSAARHHEYVGRRRAPELVAA